MVKNNKNLQKKNFFLYINNDVCTSAIWGMNKKIKKKKLVQDKCSSQSYNKNEFYAFLKLKIRVYFLSVLQLRIIFWLLWLSFLLLYALEYHDDESEEEQQLIMLFLKRFILHYLCSFFKRDREREKKDVTRFYVTLLRIL